MFSALKNLQCLFDETLDTEMLIRIELSQVESSLNDIF